MTKLTTRINVLDEVSDDLATVQLDAIEAMVPKSVRTWLHDLPVGSRLQFYTTPKSSLAGLTPIEALKSGQVAAVRRSAEGFRCR